MRATTTRGGGPRSVGRRIVLVVAAPLLTIVLSTTVAEAAPYPPIPPIAAVGTVPAPPVADPTAARPSPVGLNPAAADAGGARAAVAGLAPGQFPVQAATGEPHAGRRSSPTGPIIALSVILSILSGGVLVLRSRRLRANT